MRMRTEAEIRDYVDGYNDCYKMFCECLRGFKNGSVRNAIKKMDMYLAIVNACVETKDESEVDE